MTMAMTLHSAEKNACLELWGFKFLARTRSMVLVLIHDQRSISTSRLHASGVSTFLACLLLECFYPEFMICRRVSSHRSTSCESLRLFRLRKFQTSSCTFSRSAFTRSRRSFDVCLLELTIDMYSGLREFLTQHKLSHLSTLECPISGLHDLSSRGEIMEADTWPNQAGDMCHVLIEFSILHMLKTY
jgi:hypothetical protein